MLFAWVTTDRTKYKLHQFIGGDFEMVDHLTALRNAKVCKNMANAERHGDDPPQVCLFHILA